MARLDDDIILEPDYLERLVKVIEAGYDIASGITTPMATPVFKRDPKYLDGIVNRIILDKEGDILFDNLLVEMTNVFEFSVIQNKKLQVYEAEVSTEEV